MSLPAALLDTVYQNTTGSSLYVMVSLSMSHTNSETRICRAVVGETDTPATIIGQVGRGGTSTSLPTFYLELTFIVLPGYYYKVLNAGDGAPSISWVESY